VLIAKDWTLMKIKIKSWCNFLKQESVRITKQKPKTMKKYLLILAIVWGTASASFAANNNDISKLITKNLKVPAQLKNQKLNEKVNVQFKVNKDGAITLVGVSCNNEELKKYVEKNFSKIDGSNTDLKPEIIYSLNINFRVL